MDPPAAVLVGSGSKLDPAAGGKLRLDQALRASQLAARQSSIPDAGQSAQLVPQAVFSGSGLSAQPRPHAASDGTNLTPEPLLQLASSVPLNSGVSVYGHNGSRLPTIPVTSPSFTASAFKHSTRQEATQVTGMVPVGVPASQTSGALGQTTVPALVPVAVQSSAQASRTVAEEQVRVLDDLLDHISRTDSDKFFEAPVKDEEAPGYSSVISRPMCFQVMRQKVRQREYRTWHGFVEDFELIANNAMTYNQKRSRVHKAAITMLRAGKKHLQTLELQGRKGISLLHPDGPQAAAADEAAERSQHHIQQQQQYHQQKAYAAQPGPLPTHIGPPVLAGALRMPAGGHSGGLPRASAQSPTAQAALQPHGSASGFGIWHDPSDHLLPIDCQTEDEAGFSSFSDTDWDGEGREVRESKQAGLPLTRPIPVVGSLPSSTSKPLIIPTGAQVLAKAPQLKQAVTMQTWHQLLGSASGHTQPSRLSKPDLQPSSGATSAAASAHDAKASWHARFPESLDIIAAAAAASGWPPTLQTPLLEQQNAPGPSPAGPSHQLGAPSSMPAANTGPASPSAPDAEAEQHPELKCKAAFENGANTEGEPEDLAADASASEDLDPSSKSAALPDSLAHLQSAKASGASNLLKPSRVRQLEWQARWLQLRMKELGWQQHRASQQLLALEGPTPAVIQTAQAAAAQPAVAAGDGAGSQSTKQQTAPEGPEGPAAALKSETAAAGTNQGLAAQAGQLQATQAPPAVDIPGEKPITLEGMVGPPAHDLAPASAPQPSTSSAAHETPLNTSAPGSSQAAALKAVAPTAAALTGSIVAAKPDAQQGHPAKQSVLSSTRQGAVQKRMYRSKHRRRRQPLPSMQTLDAHPFFAARARQAQTSQPGTSLSIGGHSAEGHPTQEKPAWAQMPAEAREGLDDEQALLLPACVHWGLEQLGKHVTASKRLLLQTQVITD